MWQPRYSHGVARLLDVHLSVTTYTPVRNTNTVIILIVAVIRSAASN
jgi:hypothetical protein